MKSYLFISILVIALTACSNSDKSPRNTKAKGYPQAHFTSTSPWTREPNALIASEGKYLLFYSMSASFGNINSKLGLATSSDLIHWEETNKPNIEATDEFLHISIAEDMLSTTKKGESKPIIALVLRQNEKQTILSIQSSQNGGKDFHLLKDKLSLPQKLEFTDKPTLLQDEQSKKWIITLARSSEIFFFSSTDLQSWTLESSFKKKKEVIENDWTKASLTPMPQGKNWILMVQVDENAPNGGAGTQYFIGQFDGKDFTSHSTKPHWTDYGTQNIGHVICHKLTEPRKNIMISLMKSSNDQQNGWNGIISTPKTMEIKEVYNESLLVLQPVAEMNLIHGQSVKLKDIQIEQDREITKEIPFDKVPIEIKLKYETSEVTRLSFPAKFGLRLENDTKESLTIGYDYFKQWYQIDRTSMAASKAEPLMGGAQMVPCFRTDSCLSLHLIIDRSSIELFAEDGKIVLSESYSSSSKFSKLHLFAENGYIKLLEAEIIELKSIWK